MKRSKKKSPSNILEILNKKILLLVILFLIAMYIIIEIITANKKETIKVENKYFTGNIYSANAASNMLDYLDGTNKLISPFNINSSLAILYNGTDNTSTKELKSYFKKSSKDTNNDYEQKLMSLNTQENKNTLYHNLYKELTSLLESYSYHELTINKISSMTSAEKESLQLLLKKINLTYERINEENELSEKTIREYKLSDKEKNYNEYTLKNMLDEVLYNYESYKILNKVTNYHELYNNNILNEKNIHSEYLDNIKIYNFNITPLDFNNTKESTNIINNKIREASNNEISRVVEDKDLLNNNFIMINSINFDYEWEIPFKNSTISSKEFYNFNNNISVVDMMYIKDKESIYLENDYATGFIKKFKDNKYSFVGILPKTFNDFELSNLNIDNLLKSQKQESFTIAMPKFSIQYETDITELMKKYNVNELFTSKSNYTKISEEKIELSKNIQKVSINIGEKGTVESNISKMNIETIEIEESGKEVVLNRPFAFLIVNNDTNDIIFIGKVNEL